MVGSGVVEAVWGARGVCGEVGCGKLQCMMKQLEKK